MNKHKEADLHGIGFDSKTSNFTSGEKKMSSKSDFSTVEFESLTSVLVRIITPAKTVRCYRCFACNRHFAASRMATALVVCRECFKRTQAKGRIARQNVIDRITNDFRIFLRGRLEVR